MALEKLAIRNVDKNEEFANVHVMFNPTNYTIEQSNSWDTQPRTGSEPPTQFTKADLRKLSLELFFDSFEEKDANGISVDVRTYTDQVGRFMITTTDEGDGKRPPIIEVNWANAPAGLKNPDFPFKGVLLTLRQQFVPVRAVLPEGPVLPRPAAMDDFFGNIRQVGSISVGAGEYPE